MTTLAEHLWNIHGLRSLVPDVAHAIDHDNDSDHDVSDLDYSEDAKWQGEEDEDDA